MTPISLLAGLRASPAYNRKRFLSVHNCFESRLHYPGFRNHREDDSTPADVKGRMNRNSRPTEGWEEGASARFIPQQRLMSNMFTETKRRES